MFYKLSNIASRKAIEKEFNRSFEFPRLYKPLPVINGLEESTLPIITIDEPTKIKFGIWGLLPQNLEDNWKVFQNLTNTLNINVEQLNTNNSLYDEALDTRRCIVLITGFFTSALHEGKMYPYHVYIKDHKPFGVAGVYNKLEDGFITCSILVNRTNKAMQNIPNMLDYKPVIFEEKDQKHWLNKSFKYENLKELVLSHTSLNYFSHPIHKEFYDNNTIYQKILDCKAFDKFLSPSYPDHHLS